MTTKHWLKGLAGAVIGGGANAILVMGIDPLKFNLQDGLKNLLTYIFVSGIISASLYLKQSPVPPDDDREPPPPPQVPVSKSIPESNFKENI